MPIWISGSILLGLSIFSITAFYLLKLTLPSEKKTVVKIENTEFAKSSTQFILNKHNRIDTIILDSIFYAKIQSGQRKKTLLIDLKNINDKTFINLNPFVLRWITFHSVALSLGFSSLGFIVFLIIKLFPDKQDIIKMKPIISILLGLVAAIGCIIMIIIAQDKILTGVDIMEYFNLIFKNPRFAIGIITYPMLAISLFPIFGILLINVRAYFIFQLNNKLASNEEYTNMKNNLNSFSFYLGLLVSCAVIGTGLQRDMIIDHVKDFSYIYPKELIYSYGISYSIILASFFVPSYMYLRYTGSAFAGSEPSEGKNFLSLSKEAIDNLKLALSIVLPTISSIVQQGLA